MSADIKTWQQRYNESRSMTVPMARDAEVAELRLALAATIAPAQANLTNGALTDEGTKKLGAADPSLYEGIKVEPARDNGYAAGSSAPAQASQDEQGLLPCPFCNSSAVIEDMAGWEIHCSNDDCGAGMVLLKPDKGPLVAAWNRRAQIAAQSAPQQAVPEGWKLVPVVPTPQMVDATFNDVLEGMSHNKRNKHIYATMIAAAPAADKAAS